MSKTKKTVAVLLIAASALILSGCASRQIDNSSNSDQENSTTERLLYEDTITLSDGRKITCVEYANGYEGGVSCDWEHPISGGN